MCPKNSIYRTLCQVYITKRNIKQPPCVYGGCFSMAVPKGVQRFFQLGQILQIAQVGPVGWQQAAVVGLGKAVVDQQHDALVLRGADHPPGSLQDLVHTGAAVGVIEPCLGVLVVIAAQHLLPGADLGQAHAPQRRSRSAVPRSDPRLLQRCRPALQTPAALLPAGEKTGPKKPPVRHRPGRSPGPEWGSAGNGE